MEFENSSNNYFHHWRCTSQQKNKANTNNKFNNKNTKENFILNNKFHNKNKKGNYYLYGANNDTSIILQTIWAYDYFKNFNAENQNFNFLQRFCNQERISGQEKNLIELFLNSNLKNNKDFRKIKQPRGFLNRKKRQIEQDLKSIKSKLHKNKLIYNELLDIQANQTVTSQKIETLLFLYEQEKLNYSKTSWTKKNNNNNYDFINFNEKNNNKNENNFLSKFPYLNIPNNYPFVGKDVNIPNNASESFKNQNDFDKNNLFKSENFSFIPNNSKTDYHDNINSRKLLPFSNLNKNPSQKLNHNNNNDEEDYGYLNTEEANNNSNLLNKNFWMMEKQETQKQLTNTFSNNSHIYDYFSFRIRNSKLNNSNNTLVNTINSDVNGSIIGHSLNNTNENLSSRINQRLNSNVSSDSNILSTNKKNFELNKNKKNKIFNNSNDEKNEFSNYNDDLINIKNKNINEENNINNLTNNNSENLNTNKLPNFYNSRDFNSFILSSQTGKHSEKIKKQAKLNETFSNFTNCNFNKADFSVINQGLSDTFDLGMKKSHSPDNNRLNVLNNKYFEDTDSFKYFNSYKNNLKLTNLTNMHSKSSSSGYTKALLGQNINAVNYLDSSSKDATNKFFELTSNPFNFKMENCGTDNVNNMNNRNLNYLKSENENNNFNNINKTNNNIDNDIRKKHEDFEIGFNLSEKLKQNNFENLKKSLELSKNLTADCNSKNDNYDINNKNKNANNNLENTAIAEIKVLSDANLGSALNMNNQTLRRFKLSGFEEMGKSALGDIENETEKINSEIEKEKDKKESINSDKLQIEDLQCKSNNKNVSGGNNSDQHLNLFNKFKNKILNNYNNNINLNVETTRKDLEKENSENFDNNDIYDNNSKNQNNETNKPPYKHPQKSNMEIDAFIIEDRSTNNYRIDNNFQKLKFNNFMRNERNSDNSPIINKKRNERIENLNSFRNNENEKIENENKQPNKNKPNFEFNYIRKNLEKITENSISAREESTSLANISGLDPHESKKEEIGNSNNFDNSLVSSTNTDNIVSLRKSQDKSLVSGSDLMSDNYSQNSGKFLIDSKDKFKKVRGFNFKNNINTRKFNKPLLSNNHLTISSNNENFTAGQISPKKHFQAKEKLTSLSSIKETAKRDLNSEKSKDEISLKNPINRFNINQQSLDLENVSLDNLCDYKDKDKKVSFDNIIISEENLIYENDDLGSEDMREEKKFNLLNNNNLKKKSENKKNNK